MKQNVTSCDVAWPSFIKKEKKKTQQPATTEIECIFFIVASERMGRTAGGPRYYALYTASQNREGSIPGSVLLKKYLHLGGVLVLVIGLRQ